MAMPDYKLTDLAAVKLRAVLRDSLLNFGDHQTTIYYADFIKTLELLASFPGIARRVDNLRPGYRRYRYESNYIFFTVEEDHILIRDILHTAQNITKDKLG